MPPWENLSQASGMSTSQVLARIGPFLATFLPARGGTELCHEMRKVLKHLTASSQTPSVTTLVPEMFEAVRTKLPEQYHTGQHDMLEVLQLLLEGNLLEGLHPRPCCIQDMAVIFFPLQSPWWIQSPRWILIINRLVHIHLVACCSLCSIQLGAANAAMHLIPQGASGVFN